MEILAEHSIFRGGTVSSLQLCRGDLATMTGAEAVDCLVVSAFSDDYVPTPTSLIGALARSGISVQQLSTEKDQDLRESFSCWISKDLRSRFPSAGFSRLLCFEPSTRGNPAELTGDVFSALMPFVLGNPPIRSVAMPILASGDQQFDDVAMLESLFRAATWWLSNGMPVDTVKIVVHSNATAEKLQPVFERLRRHVDGEREIQTGGDKEAFDCFISYSREDSVAADQLMSVMTETMPRLRVFRDKTSIKPGASWQSRIDEALEHCRKVVALYSPAYLQSSMCKEEFNLARIRHRENGSVLVPVYLRSANLPLYMRSLNYIDCREADATRIRSCACALSEALS